LIYQNMKIKKDDITIKELLQTVVENQYIASEDMEKYNRNTRKLIIDAINTVKEDKIA
jgi:hypothetical protein